MVMPPAQGPTVSPTVFEQAHNPRQVAITANQKFQNGLYRHAYPSVWILRSISDNDNFLVCNTRRNINIWFCVRVSFVC